MAQPGADKGTYQQGVQERVKDGLVEFFPLEEFHEYPIAKDETGHKEESVPPDCESPDPEDLGIHVPMHDERDHGNNLFLDGSDSGKGLALDGLKHSSATSADIADLVCESHLGHGSNRVSTSDEGAPLSSMKSYPRVFSRLDLATMKL